MTKKISLEFEPNLTAPDDIEQTFVEETEEKEGEDPGPENMEVGEVEEVVDIQLIERFIGEWVAEVQDAMADEDHWEPLGGAWDDVHGGELPKGLVQEARKEEVDYMEDRGIWVVRPISESWEKTGKAPVTIRWVDTNKGGIGEMVVRSRLVARDFKGKDKDRDDLFAETPPLEAKRLLLSRAATRRRNGRFRN